MPRLAQRTRPGSVPDREVAGTVALVEALTIRRGNLQRRGIWLTAATGVALLMAVALGVGAVEQHRAASIAERYGLERVEYTGLVSGIDGSNEIRVFRNGRSQVCAEPAHGELRCEDDSVLVEPGH